MFLDLVKQKYHASPALSYEVAKNQMQAALSRPQFREFANASI